MDFGKNTAAFLKWLELQGVTILPKVAVADLRNQSQGRGLVATKAILAQEELFSVPRTSVISVQTSQLVQDKPEIMDALSALSQWEQLTIVLLYELIVLGENSRWAPYFGVLHVSDKQNLRFNQLMYWSEEELLLLEPSLILDRVGKEMAHGVYKKLFPKFVVEQLHLSALSEVTLEQYIDMASLIMSYSFDVERSDEEKNRDLEKQNDDISTDPEMAEEMYKSNFCKSMVPLADMLNADTKLHNASLVYTPDALVMMAIKPISKGEQVFNTYMDHPNSEILRRYGYVEWGGSEHDFGEIPLSLIKEYFVSNKLLTPRLAKEIFALMSRVAEDDTSGQWVEVVLDSYDCFVTHEVIIELVFIIQALVVLASINSIKSMEPLSHESKYVIVHRVFKKCYKLIESRILTEYFKTAYSGILDMRIKQYPKEAYTERAERIMDDRSCLALEVLNSEYRSLKNCADVDTVFVNGPEHYKFTGDEHIIRDIVEREFLQGLR